MASPHAPEQRIWARKHISQVRVADELLVTDAESGIATVRRVTTTSVYPQGEVTVVLDSLFGSGFITNNPGDVLRYPDRATFQPTVLVNVASPRWSMHEVIERYVTHATDRVATPFITVVSDDPAMEDAYRDEVADRFIGLDPATWGGAVSFQQAVTNEVRAVYRCYTRRITAGTSVPRAKQCYHGTDEPHDPYLNNIARARAESEAAGTPLEEHPLYVMPRLTVFDGPLDGLHTMRLAYDLSTHGWTHGMYAVTSGRRIHPVPRNTVKPGSAPIHTPTRTVVSVEPHLQTPRHREELQRGSDA